jgi:Big-like domain-containing protein
MVSKPRVSWRAGLAAAWILIVAGCGTGASGTSGSSGTGGNSGSTGGQGAGTGGTPGTGGGSGNGGTRGGVGTGGSTGTGGTGATGGNGDTGGTNATGGSAGTAGKAGAAGDRGGAAGSKGTGGTTATGGTNGTGGAPATGGTGGAPSTGGSTGTGGTPPPALAFPGAQGFAKKVSGGRAGVVYHVTNLNDSGAGSFRDAVSASNRIIVFDVGGYVQLATAVSAKSNLTIAGQTAPGGGIGFRGGEISFASSSNIIMRHVRIRPGSETASTDDDALSLYRAHDVIVDHSSMELAPWNDIDGVSDDWQNYPVTNITIQDSLIADPTGQQFGAHTESVSSSWSWYRNIFANSHNRNPLAKVDNVFVNNVLYNCSAGYTTHTSTSFKHDILNNYFIFGPASTGTDNTWFQVDMNQSIYAAGNLKDTNLNGVLDGTTTTPYWYQGTGTVLTSPWSTETTETPALGAASAARVAISEAGTLPRDPLDALIIGQVVTLGKGTTGGGANTVGPGSALYTSQAETGLPNNGYGAIAGGTRPTDTDNDGMPDVWESANGSSVDANDAMTKAADGYVLVEHYINWLAGPHAQTAAGATVSLDLSAYAAGFSNVAPTYAVSGAQGGTVTLAADKHTAQFQPTAGFHGMGSFAFTVSGSDGTTYASQVSVLVTP